MNIRACLKNGARLCRFDQPQHNRYSWAAAGLRHSRAPGFFRHALSSVVFRCAAGLMLGMGFNGPSAMAESSNPFWVYVGTYTGAKSQGIYVSRFDPQNGSLSAPE